MTKKISSTKELSLTDYFKSINPRTNRNNSNDIYSSSLGLTSNTNLSIANMQQFCQIPIDSLRNGTYKAFGIPITFLKEINSGYYSNPETTAIINKALGEVGQVGGEKYNLANGVNKGAAWCATFVSWAYGNEKAPWGSQCSVIKIRDWAKKNCIYQEGSTPTNVKPGDLVLWFPETCDGKPHHVELVTDVLSDGTIKTVSGNWANKVKINSFPPGSTFDGFVRVSQYKRNNAFLA